MTTMRRTVLGLAAVAPSIKSRIVIFVFLPILVQCEYG